MNKSTVFGDLAVVVRLAIQLFLLGVLGFTAAVGVLCIFHTRIDRQGQQLSDQGAVTGNRIASPLDFLIAGNR